MKSYNHLWSKLVSYENLYLAYKKARKSNPYKKKVLLFGVNLEKELFLLQEQLTNDQYVVSEYFVFKIYEPKERLICAPKFRDVVVQHAIMNVIEPLFDQAFINNSFACRKNKGTHKGLKEIQKTIQKEKHPKYYLKQDVKKYFPSIDKQILKKIISKKIKDKQLLKLICQIIDRFCSYRGKQKGIPIGNLTSQLFANIYLNELDQYIKHKLKIKYYYRYVDDFIIFSDSSKILKKQKYKIKQFLNKNLQLEIPKHKQYINLIKKGVDFVGYKTYLSYIRLRKSNVKRFIKRTNKNNCLYFTKKMTQKKLKSSICSYIAYAQKADSFCLLYKYFKNTGYFYLFKNYF